MPVVDAPLGVEEEDAPVTTQPSAPSVAEESALDPDPVVVEPEPEPAPVFAKAEPVEAPIEQAPPPEASPPEPVVDSAVEYTITVLETQLGLEFVFPCGPDEFILDAAERAGFAMPSSCRSGGCLVCAGRVDKGTYKMGDQYVLEEDHIERGFMLLCCSVPTSDGQYKSHQEDELD